MHAHAATATYAPPFYSYEGMLAAAVSNAHRAVDARSPRFVAFPSRESLFLAAESTISWLHEAVRRTRTASARAKLEEAWGTLIETFVAARRPPRLRVRDMVEWLGASVGRYCTDEELIDVAVYALGVLDDAVVRPRRTLTAGQRQNICLTIVALEYELDQLEVGSCGGTGAHVEAAPAR